MAGRIFGFSFCRWERCRVLVRVLPGSECLSPPGLFVSLCVMRFFWLFVLLSTACGGKSDLPGDGREPPRVDPTGEGFVQCDQKLCDVASGSWCYACPGLVFYCHSLDLAPQCSPVLRIECDSDGDCREGQRCTAQDSGSLCMKAP